MRMVPWALLLPVLKHLLPLPRLVRIMESSRQRARNAARERRVIRVAWWVSRLQLLRFPDNCLERSLLTYRFLSLAGADPHLMIGVARGDSGVLGHAWVVLDGEPVQDAPHTIASFAQLMEFGRD